MSDYRSLTACCIVVLAVAAPAFGQAAAEDKVRSWQPSKSYQNVSCAAASQYHYDLYVPRGFRPEQPTPVLFVFSPRGRVPMQLFEAAADRLSWVVCGSVESQNGLPWPQYEAIFAALHKEMKAHMTVHPHRLYFTGMSGGSRVAFEMFRAHADAAAGVIGMAAGRSGSGTPKVPGGAVIGLVGRSDFNYFEFIELNEHLADQGMVFRFVDWDGPHTWAPAQLIAEAMDWLDTQYFVRSPHLTDQEKQRRDSVVDALVAKTKSQGATVEAFEAWESLARDLTDDGDRRDRVAAQIEKIKPQLADELAAREVFREAYKPFNINRTNEAGLVALQQRMRQVAADHGETVYGKRADALARSLDATLAMVRQSIKQREQKK
ncbi:MAG: hypothetical protein JXL80_10635 [Planctomycetes bacterium]|nr:hypothetical protein [Planctomycetota bacterium]